MDEEEEAECTPSDMEALNNNGCVNGIGQRFAQSENPKGGVKKTRLDGEMKGISKALKRKPMRKESFSDCSSPEGN